ncbi:hypothetical protein MK805_12750 [Shimazuella sp. AN120528]|uniref:hypothetical protein n=1 Tax=Shimazuella soli TaxID=1892854 RepID=UPI001F0F48F3|nr:hypothetical protein [Shimazuella soli]MCH5585811.1 hypothetical protein [Shimazuella soli]
MTMPTALSIIVVEQKPDGSLLLSFDASDELKEVLDALTSPETSSENWIHDAKYVIDRILESIKILMWKTSRGVSEEKALLDDPDLREGVSYVAFAYEKASDNLMYSTLNMMDPLVEAGLSETPLFAALQKLHPGYVKAGERRLKSVSQPEA